MNENGLTEVYVSTKNGDDEKMTGKLRTIGITLFGAVELLKYLGVDLGLNQEDIYRALEIGAGSIAAVGAAISWVKFIYRKIKKD